MQVITAYNVNDAWLQAVKHLNEFGIKRPSRYGEVRETPYPVTTRYLHPTMRVLWDSKRDANPFFHLFESLWMLSGRNDVAWLARILPRMAEFSDDGKIFHGAYGYRWLNHFDMMGGGDEDETDQLAKIIRMLRANPDERRAVLQMWDPVADLGRSGKDFPCNLVATFKIRSNKLDMVVMCRSNDVCLSGETLIQSPEGDTRIDKLAGMFALGLKSFPVYAVDPATGEMRIKNCIQAWKTGVKPVLELSFDDGTTLRCTREHQLFLKKTQRGVRNIPACISPIEAGKLWVGARIWAPKLYNHNNRPVFKKNILRNTSFRNSQKVHQAYAEFLSGRPIPEGYHVHHKDKNVQNNTQDNLEIKLGSEHCSDHLKERLAALTMEERKAWSLQGSRAAVGWMEKLSNEERTELRNKRSRQMSAQMRKLHSQRSPEERSRLAKHASDAAKGVNTPDKLIERGKKGCASRWSDPEQRRKQSELMKNLNATGRLRSNHKVVSIRELPSEPVYDFTVEDFHTALVGSGVLVHNCLGCYGANAVHFSVLQEYVAALAGYDVGSYYQVSDSWHGYTTSWEKYTRPTGAPIPKDDLYVRFGIKPYGLFSNISPELWETARALWNEDLENWMQAASPGPHPPQLVTVPPYNTHFFQEVAAPMLRCFNAWKDKDPNNALKAIEKCQADDWRIAAKLWMLRRLGVDENEMLTQEKERCFAKQHRTE